VYALADGKIVLSAEMYYEGNFILINHGNKIFSGYMHLNERYYPENTYVKAGIAIGTVGATGLAIGSHLHFSIWIDGFVADPLSIYSLPIR
jgi:Membrane proteins related to metalloendopeptidases